MKTVQHISASATALAVLDAAKAEHRAEVAERALAKFAFEVDCDNCPFRYECDLAVADIERCYEEYIRIAEKELAEEREDEN